MLNESDRAHESLSEVDRAEAAPNTLLSQLREAVSDVFLIESEETPTATAKSNAGTQLIAEKVTVIYTGRLLIDSEQAYAQLDARFAEVNHIPNFSIVDGRQVVRAIKGRITVKPRAWWPNLVLFVLTVLSLLYVGATSELGLNIRPEQILQGWPYALGVILILGSHELGHYFAARHHKVAVTLPYFIPMPLPATLGTLGAFIQLREPMRNRKVLLDVGAAGPLVGLIVAIPVLLIGLKTSPVLPSPVLDLFTLKAHITGYTLEGNSILYAFAKFIVFGRFLPNGMSDVFINQLASAGWTGLLVTGLNLIPLGQLDGGHALYSLIGERARLLYIPLLVVLGVMATFYQGWFLWIVLLLLLGRVYATPLDMITPLNPGRRVIAVIALIVFVLVFMPIPFQTYIVGSP